MITERTILLIKDIGRVFFIIKMVSYMVQNYCVPCFLVLKYKYNNYGIICGAKEGARCQK